MYKVPQIRYSVLGTQYEIPNRRLIHGCFTRTSQNRGITDNNGKSRHATKKKNRKKKKNFKIHRVVFYFVHQPPKTILAIGLLPTQSTRLLFGINCCPHSGPGVSHTAADLKATFTRSDAILKSAFLEFCYNHQCGCAPSSTGLITQGLQFIATDFTPRFKTSRFRRGFALRRTPTAVSRDISDFDNLPCFSISFSGTAANNIHAAQDLFLFIKMPTYYKKTNGEGVQVEDTRIAVVMVGLPARGKSLIAQKSISSLEISVSLY